MTVGQLIVALGGFSPGTDVEVQVPDGWDGCEYEVLELVEPWTRHVLCDRPRSCVMDRFTSTGKPSKGKGYHYHPHVSVHLS